MPFFELQLLVALVLDLLFGDPRWFPHPVRIIGFFCNRFESFFRNTFSSEYLAGLFTLSSVLFLTIGGIALLLFLVNTFSSFLAQCIAVFLLYTSVAMRDLIVHSKTVYRQLQNNDSASLDPARKAVAQIVGRDTAVLDRRGIIRATVETVAENMVDGVTAPLFYAALFSFFAPLAGISPIFLAVLGAFGYKAVNTMDSMFGYKNEQYLFFGRSAALTDDFVNFIPARLSGLILIPAAALCGYDWVNAWKVFTRDRLAHASPNAAHPEAAVAGALKIELGGVSQYFGKRIVKPVIGDDEREVEEDDILRTNRLMLLASFLFLLIILSSRILFLQII